MQQYSKIDKIKLYKNGLPVWNPTLVAHLENQVHGGTYEYDKKDLESLPEVIRNLYMLWRAQAEIGGNGFEVFIGSSARAFEIRYLYEALKAVNAYRLVKICEQAIAHALESKAIVFNKSKSDEIEWFEKFKVSSEFDSLETIDEKSGSYELVKDYLTSKILIYINKNIETIAE